jgi:hypothetical protein
MIYTIIVKAKFSAPVIVEATTLEEALAQAGKAVLDGFSSESIRVELTPVGEWTIREEATQTVITHMDLAIRGLLDLYATVGSKIYEEPAVINALAVLQEVDQANVQIQQIQEAQNKHD